MAFRCSLLAVLAVLPLSQLTAVEPSTTVVSIRGDQFVINDKPTYEGRSWNGHRIEGLLMNSRMVQATFDDLNAASRDQWIYPDGKPYDADRNTNEFIEAMPEWRKQGLLAFTLNFQGGSPQGYSKVQPWHNSAFTADGSLRTDYMQRFERVLDRADSLGMVVILGYFYFGQDERLADEAAVKHGVELGFPADQGTIMVCEQVDS